MKLHSTRTSAVRILLSFVMVIASLAPLSISLASADCVPPDTTQPGVHKPVGADANTYHYDCDSNLWVNDHFSYNPNTAETTPLDPVVYTCNPDTGKFDVVNWVFSAPKDTYFAETSSVSTPPNGATIIACPVIATAAISPSSSTINNTGNASNSAVGDSGANNITRDNATTASIGNTITQAANSGNSLLLANTSAGDATTGNASDIANVVNMLQSTGNIFGLGSAAVTFVANINGDVNGDLLLDPSQLGTIQPAGNQSLNNNITLNNSVAADITNNVNLTATTGDATIESNTDAGNAKTGNAEAVANIVNIIDSAVTAGKSFIGTININGNFNGDILLPADFIDQLIANNVPMTTISVPTNSSSNTDVANTDNTSINNNVHATAASGIATLDQNTNSGNATSGKATTNITAFNLTGSQTLGRNAILVFVNVTGSWVGMIVNAPAGTTAAELGGGITQNGPTSGTSNTLINNSINNRINNNVDVAANSGNATGRRNTNVGDATSGDAHAAVNLLNVADSNLSFANWFGVLFINVFGTWHGSFGINTAAGDSVGGLGGGTTAGSSGPTIATVASPATAGPRLFRFIPTADTTSSTTPAVTPHSAVLAAATIKNNVLGTSGSNAQKAAHRGWLPYAAVALFIAWVLLERLAARKATGNPR